MEVLVLLNESDLEILLQWNVSKNHTERWGCIQGKYSCAYQFMHEDKNEVLKWLAKNYKININEK